VQLVQPSDLVAFLNRRSVRCDSACVDRRLYAVWCFRELCKTVADSFIWNPFHNMALIPFPSLVILDPTAPLIPPA